MGEKIAILSVFMANLNIQMVSTQKNMPDMSFVDDIKVMTKHGEDLDSCEAFGLAPVTTIIMTALSSPKELTSDH